MKTANFTSVCWYCGIIYKANRSSSKFCHSKHRSLYHKHGSHINPMVSDKDNCWINADERLEPIDYNMEKIQPQGWSYCYNPESIQYKYAYEGPLPDEIIIVGSYAITRQLENFNKERCFYGVKHISKLTIDERAYCKILKGSFK